MNVSSDSSSDVHIIVSRYVYLYLIVRDIKRVY